MLIMKDNFLKDDESLKHLIWEEWESEIKENDPREMLFKYMKLMRDNSYTNEGNKLTKEILIKLGFEKEVINYSGEEETKLWAIPGFHIYEDSWWLTELDEDDELLDIPKSYYKESEQPPEITFTFASMIRGEGGYKSGWCIETDTQLINLVFSLTNKVISYTN